MKLKQFIVYSLIYIGIVGVLVFVQNGTSYTASFFNMNLILPVALWFIIPLFIYAIFAVLHIIVNDLSVYMEKKAIESDAKIYRQYSKEILLGTESDKAFKTSTFKTSKEVTKFLSPWHDNSADMEDEDILEIIDMLKKVKNKEVVDLKKYKLDNTNPIVIQNELNKLDNDNSYAFAVLKNKTEIEDELSKKAYKIILKNATYYEIKKLDIKMTQDDIKFMIKRYLEEESFEITRDDLYSLIEQVDYTEEDYIKLANNLKEKLQPDVLIAMFDKLRNADEKATQTYLYLLYEFGMIDDLKEFIAFKNGEYEKFEILLFLRDAGKQIPASYFFK